MRSFKLIYSVFFLILLQYSAVGNNKVNVIDSLRSKLLVEQDDSVRLFTYLVLSEQEMLVGDYQGALRDAKKGYYLAKDSFSNIDWVIESLIAYRRILEKKGAIESHKKLLRLIQRIHEKHPSPYTSIILYPVLGYECYMQQSFDSATSFYKKAIEVGKKFPEVSNGILGSIYNDYGMVCAIKGKYSDALVYYNEALKLHIQEGNKGGQSVTLANIGVMNSRLGRLEESMRYTEKSIRLKEEIGSMDQLDVAYINMVVFNGKLKRYKDLFDFANKTKDHMNVYKDSSRRSLLYTVMMMEYVGLSRMSKQVQDSILKYDEFLYPEKSSREANLIIMQDVDQRIITCYSLVQEYSSKTYSQAILPLAKKTFADYYLNKDNRKANLLYQELYDYYQGISHFDGMIKVSLGLYKSYKNLGEKNVAYSHLLRVQKLRNQHLISAADQLIGEHEAQITFLEKSYKDSILLSEKEVLTQQRIEIESSAIQENNSWLLVLSFGMLLIFSLVVWLYFQNKRVRRWNQLIMEQNSELTDEKERLSIYNDEISSSIYYASKIQQALMAKTAKMYCHLRDVVGGVIYWKFVTEKSTVHLLLDTCHYGVPGALLTIVGVNIMQRLFRKGGQDLDVLVNEFHQIIKERLSRSKEMSHMKMGVVLVRESVGSFEVFGDKELVLVDNVGKWRRWGGEVLDSFVIVSSFLGEKMLLESFSTEFKQLNKEILSFQEEDVLFVGFNIGKE